MTEATEFQPSLIKLEGTDWQTELMPLDQLPADHLLLSKPVTRDFLEDLDSRGQLDPIRVAETEMGLFVIAGARRIKALRKLGHTHIWAARGKLPLQEAMLARSADNNQRSGNDLADIDTLHFTMEKFPAADNSLLARLTGINVGRVKKLKRIAKLPGIILEGVGLGQVAEDTARMLSTQSDRLIGEAVTSFLQKKQEHARKVRDGESVNQHPVYLTKEDVVHLQQVRVEATIENQLPTMPELPLMVPEAAPDPRPLRYLVVNSESGATHWQDKLEEAQLDLATGTGDEIWECRKVW